MSKHKNKTKKHKKVVHTKTVHKKTKLRTKTKPKTQTTKRQSDVLVLPNRTPKNINELSKEISNDIDTSNDKIDNNGSYSPSINKELVLLESVKRKDVHNCNNSKAFLLEEPLKIGIPGLIYGKYCHEYDSPEAKKFLLRNLTANKHIKPDKIVPPIQSLANCWFNTMFVVLFVSDKGRKFFHFFRQLMIEGKQSNGQLIPEKLKNGFALLNYAIDACLTGSKYAYTLNTNAVIHQIFDAIPTEYKSGLPYIKDINQAGNPMRYYMSVINYLNNKSLQMIYVNDANSKWKEQVVEKARQLSHLPHVIIIEIFSDNSDTHKDKVINKATSFELNGHRYLLDSAVIRDTSKQHFSAALTCEGKEMGYDGMSFHRLVKLEWKKYINSDFKWQFLGSVDNNKKPLTWNFTNGYQLLVYYRDS
jgi:hypothetical protein